MSEKEEYQGLLDTFMQDLDECRRSAPHLVAFAELKTDAPESSDLLSVRAAELFGEISRSHPDDPYVTHHLAILHHGKGFQLHLEKQGGNAEAIERWKEGLQAWARLVKHEGFWDALVEQWKIRREKYTNDMLVERLLRADLGAFRRHIPGYLLGLHIGIAIEFSQTDPRLAAAHVQLMLQSGFDKENVERARKRLHTSIAGDVDRACKELAFDRARQAVQQYLAIDPDYPQAICDALRVCTSECEHLGSSEAEIQKRLQLLQKAEPHANHQALRKAAKKEMFAAEAIRDYYYCLACAHRDRALQLGEKSSRKKVQYYEEAHGHARKAVEWEKCGQKAHTCFRVICINGAFADINLDGSDLLAAPKLLDSALGVYPNDPELYAIKSYYYLRKGDDDAFKSELRKAEKLNATRNDAEAARTITNLKQAAERGGAAQRVNNLLQDAVQAANGGNFDRALTLLDRVEREAGSLGSDELCVVKFLKAQCHAMLGQIRQAKACFQAARALIGPNTPWELRQKVNELLPILG